MNNNFEQIQQKGLYSLEFEHDNCGIGAIVDIKGRASHSLVSDALSIVENLEHRAGKDAKGETGDGVGILTQIPHKFFSKIMKKEGECYDIIYPDNEVEVLDILYGIEPKEEKDIISPAIYDLNPGDYRFFIPIHEPREQISFYSICDFSIT